TKFAPTAAADSGYRAGCRSRLADQGRRTSRDLPRSIAALALALSFAFAAAPASAEEKEEVALPPVEKTAKPEETAPPERAGPRVKAEQFVVKKEKEVEDARQRV